MALTNHVLEDGMDWEEAIGWIRSVTKLDIWLKGGMSILETNHLLPTLC